MGVTWAGGTVTVAYAVAHSPNGSTASAGNDPCPSALSSHGRAEAENFTVGSRPTAIATWCVEPETAARGTIVLLHGVRLDKHSMLPAARAFLDAGYRVVLLDLRGHGRSGGGYLTYGVDDAGDVSGVLDALESRGVALGPGRRARLLVWRRYGPGARRHRSSCARGGRRRLLCVVARRGARLRALATASASSRRCPISGLTPRSIWARCGRASTLTRPRRPTPQHAPRCRC